MKSDDIDDDQLDAFLRGEDELSRRLQSMPREEPSAAMDEAILARARRQLHEETRPQAANDPAPAILKPLSWRWRVPAGLAAMLLAGVLVHRTWEETGQAEQARAPAPQPPAPVVDVEIKPEEPLNVPPPHVPQVAVEVAPAPQVAAPEPPGDSVRAERVEASPPPPPPAPAPAPAAPAAAPAPAMDRASAVPMQKSASPPPLAASAFAGLEPQARVERIEALLAAGANEDAVREWDALRAAYPHHKTDPALEEKINALRQQ
jgi:hypothetical protein